MENQIGKQIRIHRLHCSMTQEKLAELLNVTPQAVSKWETGAGYPDITLLPDLSAALGITIGELFESSMQTHLLRISRMLENEPCLSREDFDYAEQRLKEGCLDLETRGQCLTMLGELYNHRAQSYQARAAAILREALALEPEKKANHCALSFAEGGNVWDWNVSNHTGLIDYYKEFVRKNPRYASGYLWLLDNLIADHRLKEAQQTLEEMRAVRNDYRCDIYQGWIAEAAGKYDEAEALWDEMVAREPENWLVWFARADAFAKRADYDRAIADYRHATSLQPSPQLTDCFDAIAQLCIIQGDTAGAIAAFERIVQILREDWNMQEGEIVRGYLENIEKLKKKRQ